jgi:histidinol-phosphatase (PHP family)
MKRLLFDSHMHTPLCKHAIGEPEEYAHTAEKRKLRGVIFTCHNPVANWGAQVRMEDREFDTYLSMIARCKQAMDGRVEVLLGLESDFAPGMEPHLEKLHQRAPFNYILGSLHPQLAEYKERYYRGDALEYMRIYFQHLTLAAQSGLFDCLSHPDLIKNLFPTKWNVQTMLDEIRTQLDAIAKTGIAMELNTSGLQKAIPEMNPGPVILREMNLRDIPVVLGSDSHMPERVGADFDKALGLLEAAGYSEVSFFIERKRNVVGIAEARESLKG